MGERRAGCEGVGLIAHLVTYRLIWVDVKEQSNLYDRKRGWGLVEAINENHPQFYTKGYVLAHCISFKNANDTEQSSDSSFNQKKFMQVLTFRTLH